MGAALAGCVGEDDAQNVSKVKNKASCFEDACLDDTAAERVFIPDGAFRVAKAYNPRM